MLLRGAIRYVMYRIFHHATIRNSYYGSLERVQMRLGLIIYQNGLYKSTRTRAAAVKQKHAQAFCIMVVL
jgi:hypothetical protein